MGQDSEWQLHHMVSHVVRHSGYKVSVSIVELHSARISSIQAVAGSIEVWFGTSDSFTLSNVDPENKRLVAYCHHGISVNGWS